MKISFDKKLKIKDYLFIIGLIIWIATLMGATILTFFDKYNIIAICVYINFLLVLLFLVSWLIEKIKMNHRKKSYNK